MTQINSLQRPFSLASSDESKPSLSMSQVLTFFTKNYLIKDPAMVEWGSERVDFWRGN